MKIKGIAYWASVLVPNTTFEPVYCIDLVISKEQADELKKQGLKPKLNKDGEWVMKFKRNVVKKDGSYAEKPKLVDSARNPITVSVGNGSEVIVQYSVYEWKNKFGSGIGSDLSGVQVLKLVEFKPRDGEEFEEEDGFVATPPSAAVVAAAASSSTPDEFDDDIPF